MLKKVGIVIICISVLIMVLGLTGNAFNFTNIKDSIEDVNASADSITFDYAYLQTFVYSFRGFFSGNTSQFGIGDFSIDLYDEERESYFYFVFTSPPPDQYGPWAERIYLGTDDYQLATERFEQITSTFEPMQKVAQAFDWAVPSNTGILVFDTVLDGLNFVLNFIQALFFIIAALFSAIIILVQVLFDVSGVVFSLIGAVLRIIGIA